MDRTYHTVKVREYMILGDKKEIIIKRIKT